MVAVSEIRRVLPELKSNLKLEESYSQTVNKAI